MFQHNINGNYQQFTDVLCAINNLSKHLKIFDLTDYELGVQLVMK